MGSSQWGARWGGLGPRSSETLWFDASCCVLFSLPSSHSIAPPVMGTIRAGAGGCQDWEEKKLCPTLEVRTPKS